jgi:hypothetical protein
MTRRAARVAEKSAEGLATAEAMTFLAIVALTLLGALNR